MIARGSKCILYSQGIIVISKSYCWKISPFLLFSELWLGYSAQLFCPTILSYLIHTNWVLLASDWIILLGHKLALQSALIFWFFILWLQPPLLTCLKLHKLIWIQLYSTKLHQTQLNSTELTELNSMNNLLNKPKSIALHAMHRLPSDWLSLPVLIINGFSFLCWSYKSLAYSISELLLNLTLIHHFACASIRLPWD